MCPCPLLNGTRTSACVARAKNAEHVYIVAHSMGDCMCVQLAAGRSWRSMRMSVACVVEENTIAGDHCIGGGGGFKVLSQRMMRVEDN